MNTSDIIGIVGALFGLIGIAIAIYENRSKARLTSYIRAQNWHLYGKSNNANGSVQIALEKYKSTGKENIDIEVLEWLSKADAFGQDVLKDVIKQIHFSEPEFNRELIERWASNGRISKKTEALFHVLTPANKLSKGTPKSGAPS